MSVLPQCLRYFERISHPAAEPDPTNVNMLVHQAFADQKELNLSWYATWNSIVSQGVELQHVNKTRPNLLSVPGICRYYEQQFIIDWTSDLESQSKMRFYRQVKVSFGEEPYLNLKSSLSRRNIAKLRSSSHDLRIEKGRYCKSPERLSSRACRFCCDIENDFVTNFESLPFSEEPILETEEHVLTECPWYHSARSNLSEHLKSLLLLKDYKAIMTSYHIDEFGKYFSYCHRIRNPKKLPT